MTKESIAKAPRTRPQRTAIGKRDRFSITNKDPNYEYRIVNIREDRVEEFKEKGWEVCTADEIRMGDKRVETSSPEGSAAMMGVGGGTKAVVMKIPKEWYQEDQAAKAAQVNEIEATMQANAKQEFRGRLDITRD